jgi:hypothetical protein
MKQDFARKLSGDGAGIMVGEQLKRLPARNRREQVLRKASDQFAMTGLN